MIIQFQRPESAKEERSRHVSLSHHIQRTQAGEGRGQGRGLVGLTIEQPSDLRLWGPLH